MDEQIKKHDEQAILSIKRKIENSNSDIFDILGVVNVLLYSKTIFKKNIEVAEFISEIFGIELLGYAVKSRTLMVAKISRIIFNFESEQIKETKSKIISSEILSDTNDESKKNVSSSGKTKKKKNENEKLETWLKGL